MQWIAENWLLLAVGGGMIAMHLFGHGHGHKGGDKSTHPGPTEKSEASGMEKTDQSDEGRHQ